ncbi:G-type lectin S-receptor-like serine/threonine-protein kinase At4g27290 [Salvia splendens]|uniref:G-type lectin S-receptor-like serine/threonine-protein kinase At4g27290 n=1 Tax=Salvia splendens TaxID=180675 RepID=UPI001C263581|nr:G-type lectin S-receptor-like serine/threonine-protein kinase At4g27290 [Salvia splendens]
MVIERDTSSVLTVTPPGILALLNGTNGTVWSSPFTPAPNPTANPTVRLLDSGNLIIEDADDDDNFLWQSFDYPCDTFLAGIRQGWNYVTGIETYILSWKSNDDRANSWTTYSNMPANNCDNYELCGPHGICNVGTSPSCGCLDGFVPREPESWDGTDWSGGRVRRTALSCDGDKFLKYSGIKLPTLATITRGGALQSAKWIARGTVHVWRMRS